MAGHPGRAREYIHRYLRQNLVVTASSAESPDRAAIHRVPSLVILQTIFEDESRSVAHLPSPARTGEAQRNLQRRQDAVPLTQGGVIRALVRIGMLDDPNEASASRWPASIRGRGRPSQSPHDASDGNASLTRQSVQVASIGMDQGLAAQRRRRYEHIAIYVVPESVGRCLAALVRAGSRGLLPRAEVNALVTRLLEPYMRNNPTWDPDHYVRQHLLRSLDGPVMPPAIRLGEDSQMEVARDPAVGTARRLQIAARGSSDATRQTAATGNQVNQLAITRDQAVVARNSLEDDENTDPL